MWNSAKSKLTILPTLILGLSFNCGAAISGQNVGQEDSSDLGRATLHQGKSSAKTSVIYRCSFDEYCALFLSDLYPQLLSQMEKTDDIQVDIFFIEEMDAQVLALLPKERYIEGSQFIIEQEENNVPKLDMIRNFATKFNICAPSYDADCLFSDKMRVDAVNKNIEENKYKIEKIFDSLLVQTNSDLMKMQTEGADAASYNKKNDEIEYYKQRRRDYALIVNGRAYNVYDINTLKELGVIRD